MTWGTPLVYKKSYMRPADIEQFKTTNITACRSACAAKNGKSGSKDDIVCKYYTWAPIDWMELGTCGLSSGAKPERKQNGYTLIAIDAKPAAPPIGEYSIFRVEERVGGKLRLCSPGAKNCDTTIDYSNPTIEFSAPDKEVTQIYSGLVASDVLTPLLPGTFPKFHPTVKDPDTFIMESPRKDCQKQLFKAGSSFVGLATSKSDGKIQFFKHDPRLRLLENTLKSPANISAPRDAGLFGHDEAQIQCPLVKPSFLNQGKCVRHTEGTCSPLEFVSEKIIKLDSTSLKLWYSTSQRLVFAVDGLTATSSPCTPHQRSRWRLVPGTCKGGPSVNDETKKTLTEALKKYSTMCNTMFARLPEDERSYSSVFNNHLPGHIYARSNIDSNSAWVPNQHKVGEWLQFNFGSVQTVAGVAVQGPGKDKEYVTKYKVQRSLNGKDWIDVPGEYDGTFSKDEKVSYLPSPVSAQYVRLVVTDFKSRIVLRADLLLCRPGSGPNPNVRDVVVSDMTQGKCSTSKSTIGVMIQLEKNTCWQHVHPDTLNVYDFKLAANHHCPRKTAAADWYKRNDINALAESGGYIFNFPDYRRNMRRRLAGGKDTSGDWEAYKFQKQLDNGFLGRFGDSVLFQNLDPDVQTLPMADALGVKSSVSTVAFDACGSRAEVQNNPLRGNALYFHGVASRCKYLYNKMSRQFEFPYYDLERGKEHVFTNVVLTAPDQLRHRVAWALSQILVFSQKVRLSQLYLQVTR